MADRHLLRRVAVRVVREVLAEFVVERELALLDELPDGDLREDLVDRAEVELRVETVRRAVLPARQPVRATEDRFPAFGDQHRPGEVVRLHQTVHQLFDGRDGLRLAHLRGGARGLRRRRRRVTRGRRRVLGPQAEKLVRRLGFEHENHLEPRALRSPREELDLGLARRRDAPRLKAAELLAHLPVDFEPLLDRALLQQLRRDVRLEVRAHRRLLARVERLEVRGDAAPRLRLRQLRRPRLLPRLNRHQHLRREQRAENNRQHDLFPLRSRTEVCEPKGRATSEPPRGPNRDRIGLPVMIRPAPRVSSKIYAFFSSG